MQALPEIPKLEFANTQETPDKLMEFYDISFKEPNRIVYLPIISPYVQTSMSLLLFSVGTVLSHMATLMISCCLVVLMCVEDAGICLV